jgi:hypothetical protein
MTKEMPRQGMVFGKEAVKRCAVRQASGKRSSRQPRDRGSSQVLLLQLQDPIHRQQVQMKRQRHKQ